MDRERNVTAGQEDVFISSAERRVEIVVIHTNEELMIAREALALWQKDTTITTIAS